jgi:hypothetical protein
MSRRPLDTLLFLIVAFSVPSPLGAQAVGVGYQLARSDATNMLKSGGPGLRLRLRGPIDLRYDYLLTDGERVDYLYGGFLPPESVPEPITYSTRLHTLFIAARARLLSHGSLQLLALPELGLWKGTVTKRSVATGQETAPGGGGWGAGIALELSAFHIRGSPIGGWVAARLRTFVPGMRAEDADEPLWDLESIRSLEIGLTYGL